jgi:pimeloyl-ACP methyl ester carboxylesterase
MNHRTLLLTSLASLLICCGTSAAMREKLQVSTGYFSNGQPYTKAGTKERVLVYIEALSFKHEPQTGRMLDEFIKSSLPLMDDYTVYLVGRKPNVPKEYRFPAMAADYAEMIRTEFKGAVDVMGISTGGQLAQYLAADYPDTVRKLVIICAAYRMSEEGKEILRNCEQRFRNGDYGRSFAALIDMVYPPGIRRAFVKTIMAIVGGGIIGEVRYPDDFYSEVAADVEMNFLDRLPEIKAPTFILGGEEDVAYPADDVRLTAKGIPGAKCNLFQGYGHNLTLDNSDEVMRDVLRFLKE